ncbi:hypothetical protein CVT25_001402 [Psilocybe cyanescens]|uniref:Translocon Sec61/SecY plug domain-containing protein n=1 Tax=Psilocybe cyanescens TaxID=93625 RepID=A0A409WNG7_PSICY|nr:hypothetical protein CVT25_001402 [Psilocybe cyanescens]
MSCRLTSCTSQTFLYPHPSLPTLQCLHHLYMHTRKEAHILTKICSLYPHYRSWSSHHLRARRALGQLSEYGAGVCLLLITQIIVAALIVIVLAELLRKRYGLGSSINLFIVTNTSKSIAWNTFSPTTMNIGRGSESEGALVALFHLLFTWHDKGQALREAFWRERLMNMMTLVSTVVIFAAVIYLRGFRIDIPVDSDRFTGQWGTYPINLFYTRSMLIMLQSALASNMFIVSQMLATLLPRNLLVNFLVPPKTHPPQHRAIGVITLHIPIAHKEAVLDPIHTAIYIAFMPSACALSSKTWIAISGSGPRDVVKQSKDQQTVMAVLEQVIPTAAAFSEVIIGLLSVATDLSGAIGSATGILMAVTVVYSHWEIGMRESGWPEMAALRGGE